MSSRNSLSEPSVSDCDDSIKTVVFRMVQQNQLQSNLCAGLVWVEMQRTGGFRSAALIHYIWYSEYVSFLQVPSHVWPVVKHHGGMHTIYQTQNV